MTGMLQSMAINCIERTGREGKVEDCPLHKKKIWIDCTDLSLKTSNAQVENL